MCELLGVATSPYLRVLKQKLEVRKGSHSGSTSVFYILQPQKVIFISPVPAGCVGPPTAATAPSSVAFFSSQAKAPNPSGPPGAPSSSSALPAQLPAGFAVPASLMAAAFPFLEGQPPSPLCALRFSCSVFPSLVRSQLSCLFCSSDQVLVICSARTGSYRRAWH